MSVFKLSNGKELPLSKLVARIYHTIKRISDPLLFFGTVLILHYCRQDFVVSIMW